MVRNDLDNIIFMILYIGNLCVAHKNLQVAHKNLQVAHKNLQVAHKNLQVAHKLYEEFIFNRYKLS